MRIEYDPVNGLAVPDGLAEKTAKGIANGEIEVDSVSSHLVI